MPKPSQIYEFGDVVIAPFDYTDRTGWDDRPSLVVSARSFNEEALDVVLMPISRQMHHSGRLGVVEVRNWRAAGLEAPSVVKPVLSSYPPGDIVRKIGKVDQATARAVRAAIKVIFGAK